MSTLYTDFQVLHGQKTGWFEVLPPSNTHDGVIHTSSTFIAPYVQGMILSVNVADKVGEATAVIKLNSLDAYGEVFNWWEVFLGNEGTTAYVIYPIQLNWLSTTFKSHIILPEWYVTLTGFSSDTATVGISACYL